MAQVTVAAQSNENPAFAPLLDAVEPVLGSLAGLVFVTDALPTQTSHAHEIAARGAHLLIAVKGTQPTVVTQFKTLPWAQVPVGDRRRDRGHGRRETGTVQARTGATPSGLRFPPAQQAVRITRTRTVAGKTGRETAYYTVSLPPNTPNPVTWPTGHAGNG